mmetsp:Transcript_64636/g.127788  ORF Transcript_64636/g.127788 Transcript_64636/m.127788 type:complete len:80 (-) Transcript_64636:954-1193(-)
MQGYEQPFRQCLTSHVSSDMCSYFQHANLKFVQQKPASEAAARNNNSSSSSSTGSINGHSIGSNQAPQSDDLLNLKLKH